MNFENFLPICSNFSSFGAFFWGGGGGVKPNFVDKNLIDTQTFLKFFSDKNPLLRVACCCMTPVVCAPYSKDTQREPSFATSSSWAGSAAPQCHTPSTPHQGSAAPGARAPEHIGHWFCFHKQRAKKAHALLTHPGGLDTRQVLSGLSWRKVA